MNDLVVHLHPLRPEVGADTGEVRAQPAGGVAIEYAAAISRHQDQADVDRQDTVSAVSISCPISFSLFKGQGYNFSHAMFPVPQIRTSARRPAAAPDAPLRGLLPVRIHNKALALQKARQEQDEKKLGYASCGALLLIDIRVPSWGDGQAIHGAHQWYAQAFPSGYYSPHLKTDETVWTHVKRDVSRRLVESKEDLKRLTLAALHGIQKLPYLVSSSFRQSEYRNILN